MAECPKECSLCGYRLRHGNFFPTCGYCYEVWRNATHWKSQRRQWVDYGQQEVRRQQGQQWQPRFVDDVKGDSSEGSVQGNATEGKSNGKGRRGKGKGKNKKGQK